ncbi:AraC family transcriptional regulator [Bradyrhizobium sp. Ai1a-2]|uniref:helix-turn-helix domain-containing protein n=1 Tax=Bradyrhizobium sp. Ai1a-2 TaxID=196490 RepID=UPI00048502A1|nr:AraC family transcriptional regulator [Bradyrhizobium sp. Ai1a-2]
MSQLVSRASGASNIAINRCPSINVHEYSPLLATFVEEIVDWDFPDSETARGVAIKVLPSTRPYFIVQYRDPMISLRRFRDTENRHGRYRNVIIQMETGITTVRPSGPLGAIIARFKPEAAVHVLRERLHCFADSKIDLGNVFDAHEVGLLEERVSEAPSSSERLAAVAQFLCAHACSREPDPVVCQAVACLRRDPSLQVGRLAAKLDVSERQLLRKFQALFGVSPKLFARSARIEKVLAARRNGSRWADIAYGCGFADQAHMIGDFNAVLGSSPERALLPASAEQRRIADKASAAAPIAYDYFLW